MAQRPLKRFYRQCIELGRVFVYIKEISWPLWKCTEIVVGIKSILIHLSRYPSLFFVHLMIAIKLMPTF